MALFQLEKSLVAEQLQVSQENLDANDEAMVIKAGRLATGGCGSGWYCPFRKSSVFINKQILQLRSCTTAISKFWGSDLNQFVIAPSVIELWSRATNQNDRQDIENLFERRGLQLGNSASTSPMIDQLKAKISLNHDFRCKSVYVQQIKILKIVRLGG